MFLKNCANQSENPSESRFELGVKAHSMCDDCKIAGALALAYSQLNIVIRSRPHAYEPLFSARPQRKPR